MTSPIPTYQTQLPHQHFKSIRNTIAIASGKGGVGKSTVAAHLAIYLAKSGARVGLLDADIYGPSIPLMMGQAGKKPKIEDNRYQPIYTQGVYTMSVGYLAEFNQALLWRGPMLAKTLIHMLDQTAWDNLDYLIIDLPPGTGDIQLSLVQKIPLTAGIVVTTPQPVATLDAEKAIQLFQKMQIHCLGLVENMASYVCAHCHHQEAIFGEGGIESLSQDYQVPILARFPLHRAIREAGDAGKLSDAEPTLAALWEKFAQDTAAALSKRPINTSALFDVRVV